MTAAVVEYVPATQLVQATLPVAVLYFPATHARHGPPRGPVYPALQVQFVDTVQPLHETPEFAGQATQLVIFVAFVATEYVAVGHGVQAAYPLGLISAIVI